MNIVAVVGWDPDQRWISARAVSREALADVLRQCTGLRLTEAERLSRRLLNEEIIEIEVVALDRAGQLVHLLESLGGRIKIRGTNAP